MKWFFIHLQYTNNMISISSSDRLIRLCDDIVHMMVHAPSELTAAATELHSMAQANRLMLMSLTHEV